MKSYLAVVVFATIIGAPTLTARILSIPSYQELLDKSDLVVIAWPTARTTDTGERSELANIWYPDKVGNVLKVPCVGVETPFKIAVVLKGDKALREFKLNHCRLPEGTYVNPPILVFFELETQPPVVPFLMFLMKQPDGRFAPTGGQTDPGFVAINRLLAADKR